jgi:tetratricopeptide (TPR) repeat protein
MQDNNNQSEIKRLQRLLMQKPKDTNVLFELAMVFYLNYNYEKAKELFLKILAIDPNAIGAHFNIANLYRVEDNVYLKPNTTT